MSIPLHGQGNLLPPDFPYRGQWILESRIFLYVPDEARSGDPAAPQFTAFVNYRQPDWAFGFDATQLAPALGITTDELFEANKSLRLTLEQIEADTPTGEGARKKRYTFHVGDKEAALVVETPMHFGSA